MLRFLKWVFFIFGGLALSIMIFFYSQNKEDIHLALDYKEKLSHDYLVENCPVTKDKYYYPCFKKSFREMVSKAGLTGISIALKFAFNFMDDDKENQLIYQGDEMNVVYSLNYLELNNIAIDEADERFRGFDFMYGGYLSSMRDFLKGAKSFSDGLINGLEGQEGISKLSDEDKKIEYSERLNRLKAQFNELYTQAHKNNEAKIAELLAKNDQK